MTSRAVATEREAARLLLLLDKEAAARTIVVNVYAWSKAAEKAASKRLSVPELSVLESAINMYARSKGGRSSLGNVPSGPCHS